MASDGTGQGWDVNSPADGEPLNNGALEIRDLRKGTELRLNKEHVTFAANSVGGEHLAGSAKSYFQATLPTKRPDGVTALDATDAGRFAYRSDTGVMYIWDGAAWQIPGTSSPDGTITTAKLGDLSVTEAKLADSAVTAAKIAANAVTAAQIQAGAIDHSKLGDDCVQQNNLAAGTLAPEYYACFADERANGTQGGTFTSGAWRTRPLQTERTDSNNIATIAGDNITLQAGTYRFRAWAIANGVDAHQVRFRKTSSGGATIAYGTTAKAPAATVVSTISMVEGGFTIAAPETFSLEHSCETTKAGTGFGDPAGFGGVEVYAVVEIFRRA